MILIGSTGRNSGKTHLACETIRNNSDSGIIGLKVTTITERNGKCPRGGSGCGVCSSLKEDYCITEEMGEEKGKDTVSLLEAGAKKVYWLRVMEDKLQEGIKGLKKLISEGTPIVAESNRLRLVIKPGLFIMVSNSNDNIKSSAKKVIDFADKIIKSDGKKFTPAANKTKWINNTWSFNG